MPTNIPDRDEGPVTNKNRVTTILATAAIAATATAMFWPDIQRAFQETNAPDQIVTQPDETPAPPQP